MSAFCQDIKQTFRNIGGAPVFFATVILTLAIGIGVNTAIFSIVKTVLLEPLPYPDPDQLVTLSQYPWAPSEIFLDLKQSGDSFEEFAAFYPQPFTVTGWEQPLELEGAQVTPNFFRLFHVRLAHGRNFVEADGRPDAPRTAIMSHASWQTHWGGSPDVVGQTIQINGEVHEIIGVLDRGFRQFAPRSENPELWVPFEIEPTRPDGSMNWIIPLARLKKGLPLQQAQSELDVVMARFMERHPEMEGPRWNLRLATIKSVLIRNVRPALLVLQLAVGVVLLIACVNVANLLLARFSGRRRDFAVRSAVGASQGRLLRQLLTESVVLSVLGGLAGLLLMLLSLRLVLAMTPQDIPRIGDVSGDLAVFLFTLGISIVTGLLFGVIPAMVTTRRTLHESLKEGGHTAARSRSHHRISQALVITEVTLTLVLLVGAGLLVRSFITLTGQAPGFRTENVLTVPIHVPVNRYQSVPRLEDFYRRVVERLQQVPGVESVAVSNYLPISRGNARRDYVAAGDAETDVKQAEYGVISPDYFRVLDIPLMRGRYFEDTDRRGDLRVAIIDEAMWREVWPQQDPIGKRFRFVDDVDQWVTVVGVVGNIRGRGLADDPGPGFYIPYQQRPETRVELALGRNAVILATSQAQVENLSTPLREGIWEVDPQQPISEIATLETVLSEAVSPQRFRAVLLGTFAAIAVILVIAGIYGVIDYLVAERTHEFGIRMAMGATHRDIVKRVLRWGLRLTALGVVLGLITVFVVNRYLASLLFGVTPTDPLTMLASVVTLILVTLTACFIPTRRATRVDPVIALRAER